MRLIIVINNMTDTFETCIPSRELSSEEIVDIHNLVDHGHHRTVHIADCGDKPVCFIDIMAELKRVIGPEDQAEPHKPGMVHQLKGVPTKYIHNKK